MAITTVSSPLSGRSNNRPIGQFLVWNVDNDQDLHDRTEAEGDRFERYLT